MSRPRMIFLVMLSMCGTYAARGLAADIPVRGDLNGLRDAITRLAEQPPEPDQALAAARGRLVASIRELEMLLAKGGPEAEKGWRQWIKLESLQQELAAAEPDFATLQSIEGRFYQNQLGLELPAFVAVRKELAGLLIALHYAAATAPQQTIRRQLTELDECILRLESGLDEEVAHRASVIVSAIEPLGAQGAQLAAAARARFCRTNGKVQVSGRFINGLLGQKVEQHTLISEVIMGSFTQGVAITHGDVSFRLIPNNQHGTLGIRLSGQTSAPSTVAERRRISVYSSSNTLLSADKSVHINDLGFHLAPTSAAATTTVQIDDVSVRSRILERMVWRRANQLVPEVENLASRRAEAEAGSSLDRQAQSAFRSMNETFCDKIRNPLIRLNALPARLQFWTDANHLRLSLVQRNDNQFAAASAAPELLPSYDLGGAIHESMLNNVCEALLAGKEAHDQDWLNLMNLLTGTHPRPLWVHDRAERWSVTFADSRPITARFADDHLEFTLRLKQVTRGAQQFAVPASVTAHFVTTETRDGPALKREGDLVVQIDGEVGVDNQQQLQLFLARKFGAVFPPELHFDGLVPPSGGTLGKLRRLQLVKFSTASGWLTLAYELAGSADQAIATGGYSRASVR